MSEDELVIPGPMADASCTGGGISTLAKVFENKAEYWAAMNDYFGKSLTAQAAAADFREAAQIVREAEGR